MCSNICRWHLHLTEHLNSKHVIFSMRWQVFWRETCLNLALQSEHVNSKEPRLVTFIYNKSGSVALFLTGHYSICTLSKNYLHIIYKLPTQYLHTIYTLPTHYLLHIINYLHIIYTLCTDTVHTIYTLSTHYLLTWPTSPRWWIISVPKSKEWASVWQVWICSNVPRLDTWKNIFLKIILCSIHCLLQNQWQ